MSVKGYAVYKAAVFIKDHWEIAIPVILLVVILSFAAIPLFFSVFMPNVEPEKVVDYKRIAREAGIPYDQLLMVDVVKNNSMDYEVTENGLKAAALDFYILSVDKYYKEYDPTPTPAPTPTPDPKVTPTPVTSSPAPTVTPVPYNPTYEWVYDDTYTYSGADEIYSFLSGAGYRNLKNESFSYINKAIDYLDSTEEFDISIQKKKYKNLIAGYDEDIVKWAEEIIENDVIINLYE